MPADPTTTTNGAADRMTSIRAALRACAVERAVAAVHFKRAGTECVAVGVVAVVDDGCLRVETRVSSYILPVAAVVRVELLEPRRTREEPAP
jgi:hypothetical protein